MTRCVSTVLSSAGVDHRIHIGSLEVDGVGVIRLHFWIAVQQAFIDLRARMWLGPDDRVPHGLFVPTEGVTYDSRECRSSEEFLLPPGLFEVLSGHNLGSFQ